MGFAQVKDLIDNVVDVWFMDMADTVSTLRLHSFCSNTFSDNEV